MSREPAPQHCPSPRELDDLELLTTGALAPTTRFNEPGSPVTLTLPPELDAQPVVELVDPEGLPLARVRTATGEIEALTHHQHGAFRRLHLTPAQVREQHAGSTFVPVSGPLSETDVAAVAGRAPIVLLALVGHGTPEAMSGPGLVRATIAAARGLDAEVVAVPLPSHGDAVTDHELGLRVLANYAAGDPTMLLPDNDDALPDSVAAVVDADRPRPDEQGLVLFFTGLSGSGKSTLARALMDRILEQTDRTVTSLDGDVVRRHLSAGLTFSKEDRETNIRRIGWVAAEISRHRGLAVCSPIAPFAETRDQVRRMVEDAGGAFFLVHVATPLEECERRDRKGLYARARRGEIPEFTGISSPYEEPDDAAVRVDTTGRTIEDALADVTTALADAGYLDLTTPTPEVPAPASLETPGEEPAEPLRVLFVCTANICRSAYMEILARDLAGPDAAVEFGSAGTHGWQDQPMNPEMAATAEGGVVTEGFRSRPLTADLVSGADLVLTAEAAHRAFILDDQPEAFRKVFTLGQFAAAIQADDSGLGGADLVARLGGRRGSADPALDVADPYRRGAEANAAAAARIEELLSVVVPALAGSRKIGT